MLVVVAIGALTSVMAFAKVTKHQVTFDNDIKVNNTVIKKGTYEVRFDDQTGQLSIVKNGKVLATAMAKLEPRSKKANDFQLRSTGSGDEAQMLGVTFGGWDKDVVLTNAASPNGNN
jgi:hypothetical protein